MESLLGPQEKRTKTDVRLPPVLREHIDKLCEQLGIPKNAFFTLAGARLAVELLQLLKPGKRKTMFRGLKKVVMDVFANAEKQL